MQRLDPDTDPRTAAIVNRFLREWLDDQESGVSRELAEYQARYPGFDDVIACEFARVSTADQTAASSELSAELSFDLVGDRYRPLRELGRGGQGVVFLAEDMQLGRKVAIKILTSLASLSARNLERFQREAALASRLDHPSICTVYASDMAEGLPFVVMRYVEGETLAQRLRTKPLSAEDALPIVEQSARAIQVAHDAGVVHRDLKPGNLMLASDDVPVVLDFGLAHELDSGTSRLTHTGDVFGTPAYMAPEQVDGRAPSGPATDVYALGAVLFEALSGAPPFRAPTREALYHKILVERPASLRRSPVRVSRDLDVVLQTALAKDPDHRYVSAQAFADDLAAVRQGHSISARPVGVAGRALRWARREPAKALLGGALLLTLAGASALLGASISNRPALAAGESVIARSERDERMAERFGGAFSTMSESQLSAALTDAPPDGEMRSSLVSLLQYRGEWKRALELLEAVPVESTTKRTLERQRIDVLRELEREAEADELEAGLGPPSDSQEFWYLAGELIGPANTREENARGLKLLRRAMILATSQRQAYLFEMISAAYTLQDVESASLAALALETNYPDSARGWYFISLARILQNRDDAARQAAERSVELDPDLPEALGNLASFVARDHDYDRAIELIEHAVDCATGGERQRFSLRVSLAKVLPPDQALRLVEIGLEDEPGHPGLERFRESVLEHLSAQDQ